MKDLVAEAKGHQLMVALRIRPINDAEIEEGASIVAHKVDDQMVVILDPSEDPDDILRANRSREKTFVFDVAFDHTATQDDVYVATTKNLIEGVLSGYNATVFAYGPTGAGKTYTMLGIDSEPGIYVRTLNDLFNSIEASSDHMAYDVSMSYLEIYNEVIRDLLNPASGFLDLREDAKGGIQIAGITEVSTNNAEEIMELLTKGNRERTQEPTAANKTSSRSHAVLQVTVKQKSRIKNINEEVRIGRLFMIDLAGTERASQTQNRGKRMKEGAHINRSLLALGNCINALSEKGSNRVHYVNYRDSKLTRLLKDSLGGNSRTVMIAHISPASSYFEESRTTLIYADRAKNIKTRVKRNLLNVSYHIAQYTSIIADLRKEIERLKAKIDEQGQNQMKKGEKANIRDIQAEVQQDSDQYSRKEMGRVKEQLINAFREQMEIRRSLMELENSNMQLHIDTSRHLLTIADWEREKAHRARKWREDRGSQKAEKDKEVLENEGIAEKESEQTEPQEVTAAREEISMLLAEQRKTTALKMDLEEKLANTKLKASKMEELLPRQISSEEQREILTLLCKVHELEVENTEIKSLVLYKENVLGQKDFVIQLYDQHRTLCDEIIQQQKTLIEEHHMDVPQQLKDLYVLYFREMDERNLDRMLTLHNVRSSALRDGSILNVARQLNLSDFLVELNKEDFTPRSAVHDNRKLLHPQYKSFLPAITPDQESEKLFKSTSKSHKIRRGQIVTPPSTTMPRVPILQKKHSLNIKEHSGSRQLKIPLDTTNSQLDLILKGQYMSPETMKDIVTDTKSISVIAAKRRSLIQSIDSTVGVPVRHGKSLISMYSLEGVEEESLERAVSEPNRIPSTAIKPSVSAENLTVGYSKDLDTRKTFIRPIASSQSNIKKERRKAYNKGETVERKPWKKRSTSFEVNVQRKPKRHSSGPHIQEITSNNKLLQTLQNNSPYLPSKLIGVPTASPSGKSSNPNNQHSGESHLQILQVRDTPPSNIYQNNAEGKKGHIVQKRFRGINKGPTEAYNTNHLLPNPGNSKRPHNELMRNRRAGPEHNSKLHTKNKK
ncbi:kinesin-like protein KIF19 [Erpetoichthys calabaricus]|uniref:kinesin-like protein KIF19 n=1 Tax=Erpetoichthys calabaricus TaxID=27687 RepID=UPI002234E9BD|nr:kinesin-like protein KIF19 [Erpetoichthys calabaricus]